MRAAGSCDVGDSSIDGEEANFLAIINGYRSQNGLGALATSASLNRAAAWIVQDMSTNGYFGHTDSLGRSPWVRIVDCGYPRAGGENLAAGTNRASAASAFELFRNSPSHNENMLVPEYRQIGIARIYAEGSKYGWYWATTFGTAGEAPAPPAPPPPTPAPAAVAPAPPPASSSAPQASVQAANAAPTPASASNVEQQSAPAATSVEPESPVASVQEPPAESETVAAEATARRLGLEIARMLHVVQPIPLWQEFIGKILRHRSWASRLVFAPFAPPPGPGITRR